MPARCPAPVRWLALALACAVPAVATAQAPNVSPTAIDFGNVGVGTSSHGEPVTLFNESGDTALYVTAGGLSGPNANQFSIEPAITARTISASESAILTLVRYEPSATGEHHATLIVQTDMGNVSVALTGTGVVAKIEVTPRDLQPFGDVGVGFTSSPQQLTIANNGLTDLAVTSVTLGGANPTSFALSAAPTGNIAAGESVSFDVTCSPQNAGDLLGKVVIVSNDPGTPTIEVGLACTGTVTGVNATPGSLDFVNVRVNTTATATVVVQNTGSATLTIEGVTWVPSGVDVFALVTPGLPATPTRTAAATGPTPTPAPRIPTATRTVGPNGTPQ